MAVPPHPTGDNNRKRRAHKKSRRGCRNCKLRSVKCDETRPTCTKCASFKVSCNYDATTPDLQTCFDGTPTIKTPQEPPFAAYQIALSRTEIPASLSVPIVISDNDSFIYLDSQSLERLRRFQVRTVLSMGSGRTAHLFQNVTIKLACSHPYLMHIVQSITATHDRYLTPSSAPHRHKQTLPELYHLTRAAALFNAKLSAPIAPSDRDGLWATAALFGTIAFSWIEAAAPEEAWPLRPSEPNDLEWLRMSEQKSTIWNLTDPLRPDSVFHAMKDDYTSGYFVMHRIPGSGVEGVPQAFVRLCGLDEFSTDENNEYFVAVHVLAQMLELECVQGSIVQFLGFISHMRPAYKRLLEKKEPRALVLLAYWYAKVRGAVWWLEWRTVMECRATCLYLEKWYGGMRDVVGLLGWPKMRCGLVEG